jgi:hypothetical protein
MQIDDFLPKYAFVFLVYVIVTMGYITEVLSCQMRHLLDTSRIFRHILGILMVFVVIMLEGGWSFNEDENNKASNNWSSGNAVSSLIIAFGLYLIFIISAKSRLWFNVTFLGCLLLIYILDVQRQYLLSRDMITQQRSGVILRIEYTLFGVSIVTLITGFIDYIIYQKQSRGASFCWLDFLLGAHKCKGKTDVTMNG